MKIPQLVVDFGKGQVLVPDFLPAFRTRCSSFRVSSMLCSTSCARSLVDAGDRLPVPVFEKSGSGLKRWTFFSACSAMSAGVICSSRSSRSFIHGYSKPSGGDFKNGFTPVRRKKNPLPTVPLRVHIHEISVGPRSAGAMFYR